MLGTVDLQVGASFVPSGRRASPPVISRNPRGAPSSFLWGGDLRLASPV